MPWHYDRVCLRAFQLFTVKVKWFLVLVMMITCAVLTPFVNVCYNGTVKAEWMENLFLTGTNFLWAAMGLSVYNMVYPDRFELWKLILAVLAAVAVGWTPLLLMRECRGSLVTNLLPGVGTFFDNVSSKFPIFKSGLFGFFSAGLQVFFSNLIFLLLLLVYRKPIKHKGVFASAIVMPVLTGLWGITAMLREPARSMVSLIFIAIIYGVFICTGVLGGHPVWAKKKVHKGPRYEFVGVLAYGLPLCPNGSVTLFLTVYNSPSLNALSRFVVYIIWKGFCFAITWLFAKIACFGMRDDVQSLTILFGMVLTFQFANELIFIAIKPFGFEFFFMLLVKAVVPILMKGGLVMDFHDFLKKRFEKNPKMKDSKIAKLILKLLNSAGDRGPSYLHASDEDGHGRELLKFLTDLMYCDLSLLTRILCAIGCTTALGTELLLRHLYPGTYRLGVWTAGIPPGTEHYMVFAAYGVVALWNLVIAYVVMWLFSRKYVKFLSNFRIPHHEQNHWIKRFRSKMLTLHASHGSSAGAKGPTSRQVLPIDDDIQQAAPASGPTSRSDSKDENSESVELLGKGPASHTTVVAQAVSEVSSKDEKHSDGVHKAPLDDDPAPLGTTIPAAVVSEDEKHSDGVVQAAPLDDDGNSEGLGIEHQKSNFELEDAALQLFYKAKMNLHDFQTNFFHRQAFYVYFWTFAVAYLTTIIVCYLQWRNFITRTCKIDRGNVTYERALGPLQSVPFWNNDTLENVTACQYFSDTANITTTTEPFFDNECYAYYSEHTVYT